MNEAWEESVTRKLKLVEKHPVLQRALADGHRCQKCDLPILSRAQLQGLHERLPLERLAFMQWCCCNLRYDPAAERKAREMIYIIGNLTVGFVKVGYSQGPKRRIKAIADYLPFPIETFALIRGPMRLERAIHKYLKAARTRGEWFGATPAVRELIGVAQSGRLQELVTGWLERPDSGGRMDLDEILKSGGGALARMRKRG